MTDNKRLTEEARERAKGAQEAWHRSDASSILPLVSVHWAQFYATDVPRLCEALEAAEKREERLRKGFETVLHMYAREADLVMEEFSACLLEDREKHMRKIAFMRKKYLGE